MRTTAVLPASDHGVPVVLARRRSERAPRSGFELTRWARESVGAALSAAGSHGVRFVRPTIVAALALIVAPAAASAASIVFIKGGNVWLAAPDGTNQRQVTGGGGWDSPSQADDGTIMAQRGTYLFRIGRSGHLLARPFGTVFTVAPPGWAGPFGDAISPDGIHQAFWGEFLTTAFCDPVCTQGRTFSTWWGSATRFSQPNQRAGQVDYVDPAWIDNSHLLLTTTAVPNAQVATYTLGGGDNSEFPWFSDRSVPSLAYPAISRSGDKLAFIASADGGVDNEIRLYRATGPPPESSGDPANLPVPECILGPNNFHSLRISFSPDGRSLAWEAPDGIHLLTLTGWPNCRTATDALIIPGGSRPYFGPANVRRRRQLRSVSALNRVLRHPSGGPVRGDHRDPLD